MRRTRLIALVSVMIMGLLVMLGAGPAVPTPRSPAPQEVTSVSTLTKIGVHPSIAAAPEYGNRIWEMALHNDKIYMGYGNYSLNLGPIDIVTYNPATSEFGTEGTIQTESIETFREINGNLYVPWLDTRGVGGIYTSDQGGSWADYGLATDTEHVYDVAVLPNGVQIAVGSANDSDRSTYLGAVAWVSYDNGQTWRIEQTDLNSGDTSTPRYYWVAVINGKAYMQARGNTAVYGNPDYPLRVFDGVRWSSSGKASNMLATAGSEVEVYHDKAYDTRGWVFTGSKSSTRGGAPWSQDLFVDKQTDTLYALSGDSVLARVSSTKGNTDVWQTVAEFDIPEGLIFYTFVVYNDVIYLGASDGAIYRVN